MSQLPREVMNFLRVHLSYGTGGQAQAQDRKADRRPLHHYQALGDLDSDLKAQKLADGLGG